MNFSKPYINKAIKDLGFHHLTPIQETVIYDAIAKRDIIGSSMTGTGKTHAYLIPVFERLEEELRDLQVVILCPTRELALQIHRMAKHMAGFSDVTIDIALFIGGQDKSKELAGLKKKQPQIVIGTPGKIRDLSIKENLLKTYRAKMLIIDEADMALEIGFIEDIDAVARTMNESLQMLVFSATISEGLKPFLRKYLKNPKEVFLADKSLRDLNLKHTFLKATPQKDKDFLLKDQLKNINPYLALIFANKNEDVDRIATDLYQAGYQVSSLHGDYPPRKRKQTINAIHQLKFQYVVVSDIVSRGLDIDAISHIINYDLPKDMTFFIHRIGRSGRMNATGEVISFYTDKDTHAFDYFIKQGIKLDIKVNTPKNIKQSKEKSLYNLRQKTNPTRSKKKGR